MESGTTQSRRRRSWWWFSCRNCKTTLKLNFHRRPRPARKQPTDDQYSRLSETEVRLRDVFFHLDGDGDGKISPVELREYFASVGEAMSSEEARGMIRELGSDGDELLGFEDFVKVMKEEKGEEEEDLKKAFEMFELEKGEGFITPKGLQRMLVRLGDPKTLEECVRMIGAFDVDGNGVVDFQEFHAMMLPNVTTPKL